MVFVLSGSVSGVVSLFFGVFFYSSGPWLGLRGGFFKFILGQIFPSFAGFSGLFQLHVPNAMKKKLGMTGGLPFGFLFWCTIRMFGGLLLGLL